MTGLILFYHDAKGLESSEIEKRISELAGSSDVISSYLQENVFEKLPETTREFLLKTSILPRLEVEFCDEYLQSDQSEEILSQLKRTQLFTSSLDGSRKLFRYHHLFQDFLRHRLEREYGRKAVRKLQATAAALCEQRGRTEEALDLYLSAEDFKGACLLAESAIELWLNQGQYQILKKYVNRIPNDQLEKQSWYPQIKTELTTESCNFKQAMGEWETIYRSYKQQNSGKKAHWARFKMASIHFESGDILQAKSDYIALLEEKGLQSRIRMYAVRMLVFIAHQQGNMKEADHYFSEFLIVLEKLDLPPEKKELLFFFTECRKHFIVENYAQTISYGEKVFKLGRKIGESPDVFACYSWVPLHIAIWAAMPKV